MINLKNLTKNLPNLKQWFTENKNQSLEIFVLLSKQKTIRNPTTFCKKFPLNTGKIPTLSKIQLTKALEQKFVQKDKIRE